MNAIVLLLDSARGRYVPRDFVPDQFGALNLELAENGSIGQKDAAILAAGPEHDLCWED